MLKLDTEEKQILRTFLQRTEVRLSTMHRIGGAFLSGAGLLVLLPIFLKDTLGRMMDIAGPQFLRVFVVLDDPMPYFITIPIVAMFIVPLYALWELLHDLTLFYFSANIPSPKKSEVFHPRFALTAIPLLNNEGRDFVKQEAREIQFGTDFGKFVLPQPEASKLWLRKLSQNQDVMKDIALPETEYLPKGKIRFDNGIETTDSISMRLVFGLAGAHDRSLIEETAKAELSLIRHNLLLRRLVMRYMKALLSLIWTALVSFVFLSILNNDGTKLPGFSSETILLYALFVWSSLTGYIVRAPVRWIYSEYDKNKTDSTRDQHLIIFEQIVGSICLVSSCLSIGGLAYTGHYALYLLLGPTLASLVILKSFGIINRPGI